MSPIVVPARWPPGYGQGDFDTNKLPAVGNDPSLNKLGPPAAAGKVATPPYEPPPGQITGEGLVARFSPIDGVTPQSVLGHAIYLPAVLNTLQQTETGLHNEYDTLSGGQFSMPAMGGPNVVTQLRELPVDTLLVAFDPKWLVVTGQNMIRLRNNIHGIVRSRTAVHLLVTWNPNPGAWPEADMDITIRSVVREVRPAENDTLYMTLSIKEWRDARVKKTEHRPPAPHKGKVHLPTKHRLAASDTLRSLAMKYYGSYTHWRAIRDANHIPKRWGAGTPLVRLPGRFRAGLNLTIPVPPKS